MPITDKTSYNLKTLHKAFAVSAATLLLTTIAVLTMDHRREWKVIQRRTALIESRITQWQLAQQTAASADTKTDSLNQVLQEKRSRFFNPGQGFPWLGKRWLELPILDALNSPRKIESLWHEELTQKFGSFGDVLRVDRCTTCHQLMQKTQSAAPTVPAYPTEMRIEVALQLPVSSGSEHRFNLSDQLRNQQQLESVLGMRLASEGLFAVQDVTISYVAPGSPAAQATMVTPTPIDQPADLIRRSFLQNSDECVFTDDHPVGLQLGDVILEIEGEPLPKTSKRHLAAGARLLAAVADSWQAAVDDESPPPRLRLTVRRGFPHPYASHPRLDLFVSESSPHKMSEFGCTICHGGQGSATAFKWASHSPNTITAADRWWRDYDWAPSRDWDAPMWPRRFVESSCLRCHFEVTELEPSKRFPEPPAAKLVRGKALIEHFGCFGCHMIDGYDEFQRRVGPDLRLEPNYSAVAAQLKQQSATGHANLSPPQREWVDELVTRPDSEDVRHALLNGLKKNRDLAAETETNSIQESEPEADRFSVDLYDTLLPLLADQPQPGSLRKVGPSLRSVGSKLDTEFLAEWIRNPTHFRPSTTMPRSFGLRQHASDQAAPYEPIEILAMVTYLLEMSQPFGQIPAPASATALPNDNGWLNQVARGKRIFEQRGCLACHAHRDFPEIEHFRDGQRLVQGPDLSHITAKFSADRNPNGRHWLYNWIKQPSQYDPRTVMPDDMLEPLLRDAHEEDTGEKSDPASDVVVYLMASSTSNWTPSAETQSNLNSPMIPTLRRLTREYLSKAFAPSRAAEYAQRGIPANVRDQLQAAERILIRPDATLEDAFVSHSQLLYIGQKSLSRYGCCGCHDIPGLEAAKPIGPNLSRWGHQDPTQLAFNKILNYVRPSQRGDDTLTHFQDNGPPGADAVHDQREIPQYYYRQLESKSRIGFLYQKLNEPRSYDFGDSTDKPYLDHLRMPQFTLTAKQREAIMTFVLGLVADPPRQRYSYEPAPDTAAILKGRTILDKYSCRECHILELERWQLSYKPGSFGEQGRISTYPFLHPHFSAQKQAGSKPTDRDILRHAIVTGMPTTSRDGLPLIFDDEEFPIEEEPNEPFNPTRLIYAFDLWEPTLLDTFEYQAGVLPLDIQAEQIAARHRSLGGSIAKFLLPRLVAQQMDNAFDFNGSEAWGWVPPSLVHEGQAVQPDWLFAYLMDPYPIRPAVTMRMPRFNLSPAESRRLVDYFLAVGQLVDGHDVVLQHRPTSWNSAAQAHAERVRNLADNDAPDPATLATNSYFQDAMKIVTNENYCVTCHLIGDYRPAGISQTQAPDLTQVHRRLRADYVRRWIARPSGILPYTSMPINITYNADAPHLGSGVPQDLFPGTSVEQLDALVNLLMNFDVYATQRLKLSEPNSER
jgi:cytochrome c551/c552